MDFGWSAWSELRSPVTPSPTFEKRGILSLRSKIFPLFPRPGIGCTVDLVQGQQFNPVIGHFFFVFFTSFLFPRTSSLHVFHLLHLLSTSNMSWDVHQDIHIPYFCGSIVLSSCFVLSIRSSSPTASNDFFNHLPSFLDHNISYFHHSLRSIAKISNQQLLSQLL